MKRISLSDELYDLLITTLECDRDNKLKKLSRSKANRFSIEDSVKRSVYLIDAIKSRTETIRV